MTAATDTHNNEDYIDTATAATAATRNNDKIGWECKRWWWQWKPKCQGGPRWSPEIQSTLVWSLCWGATGGARRSMQRLEQRRVVRARGNKGGVRVTQDQCRVW